MTSWVRCAPFRAVVPSSPALARPRNWSPAREYQRPELPQRVKDRKVLRPFTQGSPQLTFGLLRGARQPLSCSEWRKLSNALSASSACGFGCIEAAGASRTSPFAVGIAAAGSGLVPAVDLLGVVTCDLVRVGP